MASSSATTSKNRSRHGASAKVCALCGEDVSGKPRTKDPNGRYFCAECYQGLLARKRAKKTNGVNDLEVSVPKSPSRPAASAPVAKPPAPTRSNPTLSDDDIPLALED